MLFSVSSKHFNMAFPLVGKLPRKNYPSARLLPFAAGR